VAAGKGILFGILGSAQPVRNRLAFIRKSLYFHTRESDIRPILDSHVYHQDMNGSSLFGEEPPFWDFSRFRFTRPRANRNSRHRKRIIRPTKRTCQILTGSGGIAGSGSDSSRRERLERESLSVLPVFDKKALTSKVSESYDPCGPGSLSVCQAQALYGVLFRVACQISLFLFSS
jgi:hypothetical protein